MFKKLRLHYSFFKIRLWISDNGCRTLNFGLYDQEMKNIIFFKSKYIFILIMKYHECNCVVKVVSLVFISSDYNTGKPSLLTLS